MTAMTNPTLPDHGATLAPELLALAPVGGKRRPVKVVEHPAFRAARSALGATFTVLRLRVVSLNAPAAPAARCCCTTLTTTTEAA